MMDHWLEQLTRTLQHTDCVVMITVIVVGGSVPRHPGAKMLITTAQQHGTIGGGHLEYSAVHFARELLASGQTAPVRKTYQLGPALGQCCGGRVELLFETIDQYNSPHHLRSATAISRVINAGVTSFSNATGQSVTANRDNNRIAINQVGEQIFVTEHLQRHAEVWLFGAGHVGAAVVQQLSLMPCRVRWLDERENSFPEIVPSSVHVCCCDSVIDEIIDAPDDVYFVVMTHSHALDFELCLAMLQRPFAYLGLIGSATKRKTFEKRLAARGVGLPQLQKLVCPIGKGNIQSKEPYAIALSLATQLMAYWHHPVERQP